MNLDELDVAYDNGETGEDEGDACQVAQGEVVDDDDGDDPENFEESLIEAVNILASCQLVMEEIWKHSRRTHRSLPKSFQDVLEEVGNFLDAYPEVNDDSEV